MTLLDFFVAMRTKGGLNAREHWRVRHKRVKLEREVVAFSWPRASGARIRPPLPVDVHLVRVKAQGRLLDDDNLQGALKSVRDEVAAQLGVDDGDVAKVRFSYSQAKGAWGVRISVLERET